ncbi:MAG: chromosomal replication initiator protein DnaA [Clostridia bacterium]|jgi:chromosomal replication initiator protein|nr:chromosomal replication initiator protein DnaA [Clostridia bacterium]MCI1999439.1 chromosomal replication initiator protein DnaA [Clostridia bacterium]MCI2015059.1 chromosomal replication initiator protein DnaA [Clostridia bacterium]
MKDIDIIWSKTLDILKNEIDGIQFETWINPLKVLSFDGNDIVLEAENDFSKTQVDTKFIRLITNSISAVAHRQLNVLITSEDSIKRMPQAEATAENKNKTSYEMNLNPKYVFESFVVGNSNRMAHAASLAVAESPAGAYNPLFLYGNAGLGKTHLMHSIAHYILDHQPDSKVLYVTSETFTNELINSISTNKNEEFRNKYRNIDVLLIDDIQFIAQKERTQEEFFHTFNALHSNNKQIIISSDRPPKEIKTLEERLKTRFEWGLIADIQPPDYETRIAILRKKAKMDGLIVPDNVMNYIAKYINTNIRELEGALTRIVAFATLTNKEINVELAEEAMKDVFDHTNENSMTVDFIQEIVANYFKISVADLKGSKKPKSIAYPRQIGMYLSRKLLDISLSKIGEDYGGRDHTTVLHAINKIEKDIEKDQKLSDVLLELEKRIKGL